MNSATVINKYCLTDIAKTVSEILGIEPPAGAKTTLEALTQLADGRKAEKMLIYNPDAVATWLWQKYPQYFTPVAKHTQLTLPMHSVMPSVTPVNFGTIYTGMMPSEHGIQKYEKPILRCDTLFDAMLRAGKKVAIVAVKGCSVASIFLEREGLDYYINDTEAEAEQVGLDVINSNKYDYIIVYQGNYDGTMHRNGVEHEASIGALKSNGEVFDKLVTAAKQVWKDKNVLYGWVTDHGCHDTEAGRGTHGTDMPDDMNVTHFWGFDAPQA